MKTLSQTVNTTQVNFNQAVADVGSSKVMIHQNKDGFDINSMAGVPIVRVWEDPTNKAIQVEVNALYERPKPHDLRLPVIDFVSIDDLEGDPILKDS